MTPGALVEVWFGGWDVWRFGTVQHVGRMEGWDCVAVQLDGAPCASIYPAHRVRT